MKDQFTKEWITRNSIEICGHYDPGVLTLRALHYQLVGLGMTNDLNHYKRVVNAMIAARWEYTIDFETFSDLDRGIVGETKAKTTVLEQEIDQAKRQIRSWMNYYSKNRWENQEYYPEVFIEKKALQGVFQSVCSKNDVALAACKGYPSLTFLNEAHQRFCDAYYSMGKTPVIIYFGDYDPSGEDIPRSIGENLERLGLEVEVRRIALMEEQVLAWNLPPAPTKDSDTRSGAWKGIGQVELDAVKPEKLTELCQNALDQIFDPEKHNELMEIESEEEDTYREELRKFVAGL